MITKQLNPAGKCGIFCFKIIPLSIIKLFNYE